MKQGIIQWFSHEKGYGFIKAGEDEYFVHYSAAHEEDRGQLNKGQAVSFKLIRGPHGSQAAEVTLGDKDDASSTDNNSSTDDKDDDSPTSTEPSSDD